MFLLPLWRVERIANQSGRESNSQDQDGRQLTAPGRLQNVGAGALARAGSASSHNEMKVFA
jgi:hypothetical protein